MAWDQDVPSGSAGMGCLVACNGLLGTGVGRWDWPTGSGLWGTTHVFELRENHAVLSQRLLTFSVLL